MFHNFHPCMMKLQNLFPTKVSWTCRMMWTHAGTTKPYAYRAFRRRRQFEVFYILFQSIITVEFCWTYPDLYTVQVHMQTASSPLAVLRLATLHWFRAAQSKSHSKCQWQRHWSRPFALTLKGLSRDIFLPIPPPFLQRSLTAGRGGKQALGIPSE